MSCGRCPSCRKRRIDGWVFRLLQEEKVSSSCYFITLTYSPSTVPISPNGHMTLTKGYDVVQRRKPTKNGSTIKKVDRCCFTKYMKRLRKLSPGHKLKYYACGEYGDERSRPHWHAIVFNVPDPAFFAKAWTLDDSLIGKVDVVSGVSGDALAYVAGYINTNDYGRGRRDDDRVKQFSLMSKGLGSAYVVPDVVRYHRDDLSRNYLTKDGGSIIAMPRFYRDRIFDDDEKSIQAGLAQVAKGVMNSEQYAEFKRKYDVDGYDFGRYQEDLKDGVENSSNSQTKTRSYD